MSVAGGGGSCGSCGRDAVSTFGNNSSSVGYEAFFDSSSTCALRGEWPGNAAGTEGVEHERVPSDSPRPTPPAQIAPRLCYFMSSDGMKWESMVGI